MVCAHVYQRSTETTLEIMKLNLRLHTCTFIHVVTWHSWHFSCLSLQRVVVDKCEPQASSTPHSLVCLQINKCIRVPYFFNRTLKSFYEAFAIWDGAFWEAALGLVCSERQCQCCDNAVMMLAILVWLKTMESLRNGLQPHSEMTPLFSMRTVLLAS